MTEFCLKLLSGNNVVLVEAKGYESEIFMPHIVNGRISFLNIIPDRRCGCSSTGNFTENLIYRPIRSPTSAIRARKHPYSPNLKNFRLSAGQDPHVIGKENIADNRASLGSPEQPRSGVPTPTEVIKDTIEQMPPNIKVFRLHRNSKSRTAKKLSSATTNKGHTLQTSSPLRAICENTTSSTNTSGYLVPVTPDGSPKLQRNSPLNSRSGVPPKLYVSGSATKWRKCLTPIRTYSRGACAPRNSSIGRNLRKVRKTSNTESYPVKTFEVHKRNLIIDPKVTISPNTFKKQQYVNVDTMKNNVSSHLPKMRKQYNHLKDTAFDLLTNSNRVHSMSNKLNHQFRNGCINKSSSTNPKYKMLCVVPPLGQTNNAQTRVRSDTKKSGKTTTADSNRKYFTFSNYKN